MPLLPDMVAGWRIESCGDEVCAGTSRSVSVGLILCCQPRRLLVLLVLIEEFQELQCLCCFGGGFAVASCGPPRLLFVLVAPGSRLARFCVKWCRGRG